MDYHKPFFNEELMRIYIGYDEKLKEQYNMCEYSIRKHCKDVEIIKLDKNDLIARGLYTRINNIMDATDFSMTRFFVPYLNDFEGVALYIDSDFIMTRSVKEIFDSFDKTNAIALVKHNYVSKFDEKANGKVNLRYPRKNWSSLMMFNCGHPSNKILNLEYLNNTDSTMLHSISWLPYPEVGEFPQDYNFLVGEYEKIPLGLHYTIGEPKPDSDFYNEWIELKNEMNKNNGVPPEKVLTEKEIAIQLQKRVNKAKFKGQKPKLTIAEQAILNKYKQGCKTCG